MCRGQYADVVADRHRLELNLEAGHEPEPPLGEDVVEQDGVHASEHQIGVGMHVIVVRHRLHAATALGTQKDVVCDRAAERGDLVAAQIGERAEA